MSDRVRVIRRAGVEGALWLQLGPEGRHGRFLSTERTERDTESQEGTGPGGMQPALNETASR